MVLALIGTMKCRSMVSSCRQLWFIFSLLLASAFAVGCDEPLDAAADSQKASTPSSSKLPPLLLRDDTANLLLTWVDGEGDFHVVRKPQDVPEASREKVRVVVTDQREGTGSLVYVADLRKKKGDGSYPTGTLSRSAWDEIGADRRQKRMEATLPKAPPASSAPDQTPGQQPRVVIYGAKWCSACREAARFFKQRGLAFLEKDVDESALVQQELRTKLKRAGLPPTSSIPVLDISGKLLVGFNANSVENALRQSEGQQAL